MKKFLFTIVVILMGLNLNSSCLAATSIEGTISRTRPDNNNAGGTFVFVNGTIQGEQVCERPIENFQWYFIRKDNPLYKELTATALSATVTGKQVVVRGNGICTDLYEGVRYIEVIQ